MKITNKDYDKALAKSLVDTLFNTPSRSTTTSFLLAVAITFAAQITHSNLFYFLAAIVLVCGLTQSFMTIQYRKPGAVREYKTAERHEIIYTMLSAIISLDVGIATSKMLKIPIETGVQSLACGILAAYSANMVPRYSSRPLAVLVLTSLILTPPIAVLFENGSPQHTQIAILCFLFIIANYISSVAIFRQYVHEFDQKRATALIAKTDKLSALANRYSFDLKIGELTEAGASNQFAVLFCDLDHFKEINDTHGHDIGDAVIIEMANRLRATLRDEDFIARLGGDEFIVLIENSEQPNAIDVAMRLTTALSKPMMIDELTIACSASIGIAIYPQDGPTASNLLKHADNALYASKKRGGATWTLFNPEMDSAIAAQTLLIDEIYRGVKAHEFFPQFIPIYDLRTNSLLGYEAKIAWRHPHHGVLPESTFIAIIAAQPIELTIREQVLYEACAAFASDDTRDNADFISIDVCQTQLRNPSRLIASIEAILKTTGLPANNLRIEIDEACFTHNKSTVADTIKRLTELGATICIDNYGASTSSLFALTRYPIHAIKIAARYCDEMLTENATSSIIRSICMIASVQHISMEIDGVSDNAQGFYLSLLGIQAGQNKSESCPIEPAKLCEEAAKTIVFSDHDERSA